MKISSASSVLRLVFIMLCYEGHVPCLSFTTHHHVVFSRKGSSSVLSFTTHHHVLFSRKIVPPCLYQSQQLHSSWCAIFWKGVVLRAINPTQHHVVCTFDQSSVLSHNSDLMLFFERGTSSVLSYNSSSCCYTKGHVLRAINQLHVVFAFRHVPPCYQSQSHHPLCFHERASSVLSITTHHRCVFTKGTSSVLSITTHHTLFFTRGTSSPTINHNSSSCCVCFHERARPSVLSILITLCFHERAPLRAINHNSSSCCVFSRRGTSSVLYHHNSSSCCVFTKGRPSVLSITTSSSRLCFRKGTSLRAINHLIHHVVFSRSVPPCYQSQLIIMLCFHEGASSVLSILIIVVFSGHVLRAINRSHHRVVFSRRRASLVLSITTHIMLWLSRKGTSSVLSISHIVFFFFTRGHVPPCYQSQLIISCVFTKGGIPQCHQSSSRCVFTKGRPSVLSITTHHHVVFSQGHVPRAINHLAKSTHLVRDHTSHAEIHPSRLLPSFPRRHISDRFLRN
jgi:hypothetical protein